MGIKEIIIAGTTGFSVMIKKMVEQESVFKVIGFTTKRELIKQNVIDNCPVFPEEELNNYLDDKKGVLNTLGYTKMNTLREDVHNKFIQEGFELVSYISPKANIFSDKIGKGCIVLPGAFIGPEVIIGDSCIVYSNVQLTHHINIADFCFIASNSTIGGNVEIQNHCFIGMNSTIRNKLQLAPYTLVGCASNVIEDVITPNSVIVGNPAKCLSNKKSLEVII